MVNRPQLIPRSWRTQHRGIQLRDGRLSNHLENGSISGAIAVTATVRPQLSEGQSHFAVSQFKVPDTRRAAWFLRQRLPRLFRARHRAGRREPAWEPGLTPLSVQPSSAKGDILWPAFVSLAAAPLRAAAHTDAISDGALARSGLTDLGWLRGVAILIPEVRGDLVGRIRIEYSGGLPHRCWMLMVAFSFAASVAPTAVSKRIRLATSVPAPWVDRRAQEPRTK